MPSASAQVRIICFPFAGGGASVFQRWFSHVPDTVQVCPVELPGRETRFGETLLRDFAAVIQELAPAAAPYLDCPYVIFGHSLGGFLAFELARELRRRSQRLPFHFFASACRAPHLPSRMEPVHDADDAVFLNRLGQIGGLPHLMKQSPEMMELLLPIVRADFQMAEQYRFVNEPAFDFPITALGGSQDRFVCAGDLVAWHTHTTGPFRLRLLAGGHLFLSASPERVIETVLQDAGL